MKSSVHPVPLLLFLSVIFLITSFWIYGYSGPLPFLVSAVILSGAAGWLVGRNWRLYPWQIGVVSAIPSVLFVLWLFFTEATPQEAGQNISTFIFHPLLVLIGAHFGGLMGRWQALKSKSRTSGNGDR
jgi:hypothetical protein